MRAVAPVLTTFSTTPVGGLVRSATHPNLSLHATIKSITFHNWGGGPAYALPTLIYPQLGYCIPQLGGKVVRPTPYPPTMV